MMGSVSHGQTDLLTPEQRSFLTNILGSQSGPAQQAYGDFLQPYSPDQFQDFYQKTFIDPAQQTLQRQVIPGIKENFLGLDESASSALNRALAQSATDVSTTLGQGMLGQYNQQQSNRLSALSGLGGLAGSQTFQPYAHEQKGLLPGLLNVLSGGASSYFGGGF